MHSARTRTERWKDENEDMAVKNDMGRKPNPKSERILKQQNECW
jgi:hypothetical protein